MKNGTGRKTENTMPMPGAQDHVKTEYLIFLSLLGVRTRLIQFAKVSTERERETHHIFAN